MSGELAGRRLDVDLLVRELGNWRTSSVSGPAYQGLADGLRMLIVDGRLPVGAQLPSERALADALRVSRTTVTAAYTQMREDGYLKGRQGARSTTALPVAAPAAAPILAGTASANLAAATLAAPVAAVAQAFVEAADHVTPYLHDIGIELVGVRPLREAIAERYCARGLPTEPDEIMVTTGALHAIGLIMATYTQPGDRVLVEQPTYHGALAAMATKGVRPVPVAMTPDGWDLGAVDAAVRQLSPSLAYLIPDNHNPTGMTLPPAGRRRLAQIIAETRTRTIIDETITDMWLDEAVPPPFAASMAAQARPGVDRRIDVEVVLGRSADRVDPRRTQCADHHRGHASRHRHGHADPRTTRRREASRVAPTTCCRTAARRCARGGLCCSPCSRSTCPTGGPTSARAGCRCGSGCPPP